MIGENDCIVAGVSGGADSICLLFVLLELQKRIPFRLAVAHVNHKIRREAGEDADFVKNICRKKGLPFCLLEEDVKDYARRRGIGEEEAGREIRYRFFRKTLAGQVQGGQGRIAVAHNGNDRAETMLFHLFRGTGLAGMSGIRPINGDIIRPLLCVERDEIEAWLLERGIEYRTDSTNGQDDYARNRIRHHILSYAREQICSGAVANMNRAADDLLEAETFVEERMLQLRGVCVRFVEKDGARCAAVSIPEFLAVDRYLQGRILLSCMEEVMGGRRDITAAHVGSVRRLFEGKGNGEIHLPCGFAVYRDYDVGMIGKRRGQTVGEAVPVPSGGGRLEVPGLGTVEIAVFPCENCKNIPKKTYTKWFDYDKITKSMVFRTRRTGDYLTVNRTMGRKSLRDYFINEKIPRQEREELYVLADGSHIVWVPGYRISEYYKVSENTVHILQVKAAGKITERRKES